MVIAVSGASGYVGGVITRRLLARGHKTVALGRGTDAGVRRFVLGEPPAADLLEGVDAVVHAAWDLEAAGEAAWERNVGGSTALIALCMARSLRLVFISSLSAFRGCRSTYGRTKLAVEAAVTDAGGTVLRPGLVYGSPPAGLYAAVVGQTERRRVIPVVAARRRLYMSHDLTLGDVVAELVVSKAAAERPVFAAAERATNLEELVSALVSQRHRAVHLLPVPAGVARAGLGLLERLPLQLPFRSDSITALTHPIPLDQVAELLPPPLAFPEFPHGNDNVEGPA